MNGYKTYTGILITALPLIASMFGYELSEHMQAEAASLLEDGIQLIGLFLAFYGRITAIKPGWLAQKSSN